MSTKAKAAVAAVVVVLASLATWRIASDSDGGGDAPSQPDGPPVPPLVVAEVPPAPEPEKTPAEVIPAKEEPSPDDLPVTVLGPDGEPVPKVRLSFRKGEVVGWGSNVETGEDGRATIEADGTGTLVVVPEGGLGPRLIEGVTGGREIEVRLTAGPSIQGYVIDRHGAPVVGSTVRAKPEEVIPWLGRTYWRTAVTDEEGSFEIFGLVAGRYRLVSFAPPAAGSQPEPQVRAATGDRGVRIVHGPLIAPVIRVVDHATGTPLETPRSYYLLHDGAERHLGGNSLSGDFGMWKMPPEGTRLKVTADGYHEAVVDLPREGEMVLVVRLLPDAEWRSTKARLDLTVTDDAGRPLGRVRVTWRKPGWGQAEVKLTDGRGTVHVPPGDHVLGIWSKGYREAKVEIVLSAAEQASREVVLQRLGHIDVLLPPEGCGIRVLYTDGTPSKEGMTTLTIKGGLRVSLPPGKYILRLTKKGSEPVDREITIVAEKTIKTSRD